ETELQGDAVVTLRQQEALPVLQTLKTWMETEYPAIVLKKSPIAQAMGYFLPRWKKLCIYTTDARLNIDNNLVENAIRPVALGRKNYLFAGSHEAARRSGMLYSLLGTCRINGIEPYTWLKNVLEKISSHPINKIKDLLPHHRHTH